MHRYLTPNEYSRPAYAYLKWPRLIAFLLTGALGLATLGLAIRSLVQLVTLRNDLKHTVKNLLNIDGAKLLTTDVLAVVIVMTLFAALVGIFTIILSIIVVSRLQREETLKTIRIKEGIMVFLAIALLGSSIAATVIIVPRSAGVYVPGIPNEIGVALARTRRSLKYRDTFAFPTMILAWLTFGSMLVSFLLAAITARYIRKTGAQETLVGRDGVKHPETGEIDPHSSNLEKAPVAVAAPQHVNQPALQNAVAEKLPPTNGNGTLHPMASVPTSTATGPSITGSPLDHKTPLGGMNTEHHAPHVPASHVTDPSLDHPLVHQGLAAPIPEGYTPHPRS